MPGIDEILDDITPEEDTVSICTLGGVTARLEQLEAELLDAHKDDSLGNPRAVELAEEIAALEAEAAQHTHTFTLRALSRRDWRKLLDAHQPSDAQRRLGYDHNPETFPTVALAAVCVDPELTVGQAQKLENALSDGQWSKLWNALAAVNGSAGEIPKSDLATAVLRASKRSSTTAVSEASPEASS